MCELRVLSFACVLYVLIRRHFESPVHGTHLHIALLSLFYSPYNFKEFLKSITARETRII